MDVETTELWLGPLSKREAFKQINLQLFVTYKPHSRVTMASIAHNCFGNGRISEKGWDFFFVFFFFVWGFCVFFGGWGC